MIWAEIRRNQKGNIYGFTVKEHGESVVCAAISMLSLNTVNSIEALVDEEMTYNYNPNGGFLEMDLPRIRNGKRNREADLLLESLALGLRSVKASYSNEIEIEDDKV